MVLGLHSAPGNTSAGVRRWLGAALKVVRVCPTSRQILQNMKSNTSWASVAPWVWVCHHPVWGLIISSLCGEAWDHHRGGCGIPRLRTFVEKFFVNVKTLFYAERRAQPRWGDKLKHLCWWLRLANEIFSQIPAIKLNNFPRIRANDWARCWLMSCSAQEWIAVFILLTAVCCTLQFSWFTPRRHSRQKHQHFCRRKPMNAKSFLSPNYHYTVKSVNFPHPPRLSFIKPVR